MTLRSHLCALLTLAAAALAVACGSSLPRPAKGPHIEADFSTIERPPPNPRSQSVPSRPSPSAVWVDGEWVAVGENWVWQAGGWIVPPPGAKLALWELRWQKDGTLRYAPSVFHLPDGSTVSVAALLGLEPRQLQQPFCTASAVVAEALPPLDLFLATSADRAFSIPTPSAPSAACAPAASPPPLPAVP